MDIKEFKYRQDKRDSHYYKNEYQTCSSQCKGLKNGKFTILCKCKKRLK